MPIKLIPLKEFGYYFAEISELQESLQRDTAKIDTELYAERDLSLLRNRLEALNGYKSRLSYLTPFVNMLYSIKQKEVTDQIRKKYKKEKSATYIKAQVENELVNHKFLKDMTERLSSEIELKSRNSITEVSSLTKELIATGSCKNG
jgi:hypothetical protein